ncbi:MAG: DUF2318 domain-containing protein [Candidatus Diapherotrites archaeon]
MKKILMCILGFLILSGCVSDNSTGLVTATQAESDSISIPVSEITTTAKWFEYESSGTTIRFFAVKASDGSIKTAFDACDVCYGAKKGYSQSGDVMVCNNCGNKYSIDSLGTENKKGSGCWPGYLPSSVIGDNLVIKNSDLEKGRNKFI